MASSLGISEECAADYQADEKGVSINFEAIGKVFDDLLEGKSVSPAWKDEITEYYNNVNNSRLLGSKSEGPQKRLRLTGGNYHE